MILVVNKLLLFLKFIFFPRSIGLKSRVVDGESFTIDFKSEGLTLIISFAGLGDNFEFRKTLTGLDVNVVYLRDLNHNWYLNGLDGIGPSVQDIVNFVRDECVKLKAKRIVTLGVSAGGFGALLFGSLIEADATIAFSPQTFMNRANCLRYFDYRWLDRVIQIEGNDCNKDFRDLKQFYKTSDVKTTIVFDARHRLDNAHAMRLKGDSVEFLSYEAGGHKLVQKLKENGRLLDIIKSKI